VVSHEPDVKPDIAPEFEIELEPGPVEDLSHLHESARLVARLPAAERLARVRADRWIGYTRATQALTSCTRCWIGRPSSGCRICWSSGRPTTASR
jgi:hypothetical protein